ncbi:hypothetical protein FKW77_003301 [Venturia effusa]|uniref:GH64 domain-containing protein n=1 Tax=Venturia effusa TaxID=50376 RepID=A0A517LF53_9PEZI|nr:hypothetical protein FKW77_003301 [Venturia effusa]
MTPPTLDIKFKNTTDSELYATITGLDLDNNSKWFVLRADGKTAYHPANPSKIGSPLQEDCAIKIGGPGAERTVTIPHIAGGRIYFAINEPVTFFLNPGPALVEPSVTNPSDANFNKNWGFCEFTFNNDQLYANISYVDFVGLPVAIALDCGNGEHKKVLGIPSDGISQICSGLEAQKQEDGHGWDKLIFRGKDGHPLRVLSPNQACVMDGALLHNYYEPYVDEVWKRFSTKDITIDTIAAGVVKGRVKGDNLILDGQEFQKPTTRDIFNADGGPFRTGPDAKRNAIIPRLNAEFNRSTYICHDGVFPAHSDKYYKHPVTNHYARLVHAANIDGRGYAHPYDDASPPGGGDQSGFVNDGNPKLLTVTIGGKGDTTGTTETKSEPEQATQTHHKHFSRLGKLIDKFS